MKINNDTPWNFDPEDEFAKRKYQGFTLEIDMPYNQILVTHDDLGWCVETPQFTGRIPLQHLMAYAERIVMAIQALNSFKMSEHWHQVPEQEAKRVHKQRERFMKKKEKKDDE